MKAVILKDNQLEIRKDYPIPIPQSHEALIKVTYAGICSTDLEILRGYIPNFKGVMGHEFCGVVEAAEIKEWIGKRVCGKINILNPNEVDKYPGCCLEHHPQRTVLGIINKDGCFAEYLTLPVSNLIEIPDNVSDEEAAFTEPLAAALRIREQISINPSTKVAVLGAGKLGMLIGKVMQFGGTDVYMKCRSSSSFALPLKWKLKTGLLSETENDSFSLVVEATGNIEGFREALRIVKPMGTVILKSTFSAEDNIDLTKVVVGEIKIQGSRCGPFPAAMRVLERKEIPVTDLIEKIIPMSDAKAAIEVAQQRGKRKVLLKM